jgi:DNA repair protein RadC
VGQARLLAAFEVSRRYFQFRMRYERIHSKPEDLTRRSLSHTHSERAIAAVPEHLRIQSREWLGFVPVYQDGRPGEFCLVESGVRTHVNTDPVELFSRILALRPGALYLMHNHPSGILIPSESDRQLTEQVEKICAGFSIRLLGHAIVTARSHLWIML